MICQRQSNAERRITVDHERLPAALSHGLVLLRLVRKGAETVADRADLQAKENDLQVRLSADRIVVSVGSNRDSGGRTDFGEVPAGRVQAFRVLLV